ncbi:hypothetical protein U062_00308 [Gammaproteobacteria bacterium MOLA455]|nr:hypothetical protein U062_00308 [Gammaproteobacteria bacterium MOLA455]
MSDNNTPVQDVNDKDGQDNSKADAIASVAVLTIIIVTVVYWLSSL